MKTPPKKQQKTKNKFDLLEDLKMVQEFYTLYTLLNFNFVMIYIIHNLLLKNHLIYLKDGIFKCFFKEYDK